MAKVSLRAYNRDIESMIDRTQLDEAIAHCQHILKTFPKHLETYRLLGKAYLEYKRPTEAVDVFTRVLTVEPNDFVANVGMSIIRDEENKLDDAIWHMERAFEVQSANPAIQGELQRLYARRDGVAPPRIRMTRGALAHMYMRGELYPQAISEARSVLKEDAGRVDMQILLALAFYRSGQKNEAADNASSVLRRYQYCLDANRVMVEILGVDRPESVQPFRQRVYELDPYATQVNGTVFQTSDVNDNAVAIERLEWNGQPIGRSIDWNSRTPLASGGLGASAPSLPAATPTPSNAQPDWLKAGGFADSQPTPPPPAKPTVAPVSPAASAPVTPPTPTPPTPVPHPPAEPAPVKSIPADDNIPDFLRAAGWGQSTGTFDESKSSFDEPETPAASGPIQQGDLPDWVKEMMPNNAAQSPAPPATPEVEPAQEEDLPDWIKNIGAGSVAAAATQSVAQPDWLQNDAETSPPAMADSQPDWMSGLTDSEVQQPAATSADDSLDWLSNLGQPTQGEQPDWMRGFDEPAAETQPQATDDSLDWLSGLDQPKETSAQPVQPDWMKGFDDPEAESQPQASTDSLDWLSGSDQPETASSQPLQNEQPDWLKFDDEDKEPLPSAANDNFDFLHDLAREPATPATSIPTSGQSAGTSQQDIDDSLAWLENLAAKQGATEGLLIKPEDRKDKQPDWVAQTKSTPAETPAPKPEPVVPPAPTPALSQSSGTSQQDIDDSLAWLENLAAKQGATEGLLIKPEDRKDKEPDWVAQAKSAPPEPPAPKPEPVMPPAPTPASSQSGGTSQQDIDDSLAWLENLAAKQGATEGLLIKPEDRKDKEPDWVAQAKSAPAESPVATPEPEQTEPESVDDMPAWLSGLDQDAEPAPVAAEDSTAMWLQSLDEPEPFQPLQNQTDDDLPAWLRGSSEEEKAPVAGSTVPEAEVTNETDWMNTIEEQQPVTPASMDQNIPVWLKGIEEDSPKVASGTQGDLPAWLRDDTGELVAEPTKIEPTRPSDWTPAVEQPAAPEPPKPQPKVVQELPKPAPPLPPVVEAKPVPKPESKPAKKVPTGAETEEIRPATPPAPYKEPVTMRGTGMLNMPVDPILGSARSELSRSNIPGALEIYGKLIKKGRFLDETIFDLRDALDRFPVEVSIWQTLGDAYMRANRLQDALDAYTKAEELLR